MKYFLLIFLSILFTQTAFANIFLFGSKKKSKGIDFSITQYTIKDISLNGGTTKVLVPKTLSAELAFRVYHSYMVNFLFQQSTTDPEAPNLDNQQYGLGFKVNLPGIFLVKARKRHLIARSKNKPNNTAIYANLLKYKKTNSSDNSLLEGYETTFGFEYNLFLFSPFYFKLNAQLHNRAGNFFTGYGFGLGYEF